MGSNNLPPAYNKNIIATTETIYNNTPPPAYSEPIDQSHDIFYDRIIEEEELRLDIPIQETESNSQDRIGSSTNQSRICNEKVQEVSAWLFLLFVIVYSLIKFTNFIMVIVLGPILMILVIILLKDCSTQFIL